MFQKILEALWNLWKEDWYLTTVEHFQCHNTTLFYRNPILIYEAWIANKVSRLNALSKQHFIPFCWQERLGSIYLPREYSFTTPRSIFSWEITVGKYILPHKEVLGSHFLREYIFTVTPEIPFLGKLGPKNQNYLLKMKFPA